MARGGVDAQPRSAGASYKATIHYELLKKSCAFTMQSPSITYLFTEAIGPSLSWNGYYDILLHEPCARGQG